jgi:predicted negative regulator of RcsB-dependent stress response
MAKKNNSKPEEAIALDVQLTKTEAFIEKNLKKILCAIAVVVVVVVAFFAYNNYTDSKNDDAQKAIAASQEAFAQQQYDKALSGDGAMSVGFLRIIDEYSGTKTANLAKLYAAICYANTEKYDEAIKMFESYSKKDDQMISPASTAALANCYVQKGDNAKGIDLFIKAAKEADNDALSPVFLMQAAKIYQAEGQNEKAAELYQEIKKKYFRSPVSAEIDKYIEAVSK